ncbi:hypothetical protein FRC12_016800 [Ceratobasidium sp. 428]|nr:hypothetical protein FRC12_016800 [Ceratobasidium sp. 428]
MSLSDDNPDRPSDDILGHGKQTITKTKAIAGHEATVQKSAQNRESRVRTKKLNEQEELLQAQDDMDAAETAEKELEKALAKAKKEADALELKLKMAKEKAQAQPKEKEKTQTKGKAKASGSAAKPTEVPDGDPRERERLMNMIYWAERLENMDGLKTLKFAELQARLKAGEAAAAAKSKKSSATKTPKKKKVKASQPMVSTITLLGSPLDVLQDPPVERAVEPSPVPKQRKRDMSTTRSDEAAKHARLDSQSSNTSKVVPNVNPKIKMALNKTADSSPRLPSVSSVLSRTSVSRGGSRVPSNSGSNPGSRANSLAPTHAPSRATSSSRSAGHKTTPVQSWAPATATDDEFAALMEQLSGESDGEENEGEPDSDDEGAEESDGVEEDTSKAEETKKKVRPSMGMFKGEEAKIMDEAFTQIAFIMAIEDMCPGSEQYVNMIMRGWNAAVRERGHELQTWLMTQENETVLRQRLNSFRARLRDRVLAVTSNDFKLYTGPEATEEDIMARAASLVPDEFHRDPAAKTKDQGQYQNPIVSRTIYAAFFTGQKPNIGLRFKQDFEVMPQATIAFICGLMEYLIRRHIPTGVFVKSKENKMDISVVKKPSDFHFNGLDSIKDEFPDYFTVMIQEGCWSNIEAYLSQASERRKSKSAPGHLKRSAMAGIVELTTEQIAEIRAKRKARSKPSTLPPALPPTVPSDSWRTTIRPTIKEPSRPASSAADTYREQEDPQRATSEPAPSSPTRPLPVYDDVEMQPADPAKSTNDDDDDDVSVVPGTDDEAKPLARDGKVFAPIDFDASSTTLSDDDEWNSKKGADSSSGSEEGGDDDAAADGNDAETGDVEMEMEVAEGKARGAAGNGGSDGEAGDDEEGDDEAEGGEADSGDGVGGEQGKAVENGKDGEGEEVENNKPTSLAKTNKQPAKTEEPPAKAKEQPPMRLTRQTTKLSELEREETTAAAEGRGGMEPEAGRMKRVLQKLTQQQEEKIAKKEAKAGKAKGSKAKGSKVKGTGSGASSKGGKAKN